MNDQTKIRRFILAGLLALSLLVGPLNVTGRISASNSVTEMVTTSGTCWKCS